MAPRRKADELKAREARQKKLLAVLGVVFVALLVIQGPKLMKHGGSPAPVAAAPPTTTDATTTPTTLAPPTLGATDPTPTASAPAAGKLADSDVTPTAGKGQLVRFDLFASKDPFVQQVKDVAAGGASVPTPSAPAAPAATTTGPTETSPAAPTPSPFPSGSGAGGATPTTPSTPAAPAVPTTAVAELSVNGRTEQVAAGGDFPAAAPVFHLVSLDAASARISVVGGSYQDGSAALKLLKGRPVTLQDTADGTTYRLVYLGGKKVPTASLPTTTTTTTTAPAATTVTTTAPAVTVTAPTTTTTPATTTAPSSTTTPTPGH